VPVQDRQTDGQTSGQKLSCGLWGRQHNT